MPVRKQGIMLAKKTSKNQITLPKEIAGKFADTVYFDVAISDNQITLIPVKLIRDGAGLQKVRQKMQKLGITQKDVEEAIAWARKNST
jgi:hypothetical protein